MRSKLTLRAFLSTISTLFLLYLLCYYVMMTVCYSWDVRGSRDLSSASFAPMPRPSLKSDDGGLRLFDAQQRRFLSHMDEVCRSEGRKESNEYYVGKVRSRDSQRIRLQQFIVDEKRSKSLYCHVFKAGSTFWLSIYSNIYAMDNPHFRHQVEDGSFYRVISKMSAGSSEQVLSSSLYSFLVVRHPFVRLISAYRDRILRGQTHQSRTFVPRIFRLLGKHHGERVFNADGVVQLFPSFEDFLLYLLARPDDHDPHWQSISSLCAPCLISWRAVVRLEDQRDIHYLGQESNLTLFMKNNFSNASNVSSSQLVDHFYAAVDCKIVHRLYEDVYKMDFMLFNYKPNRVFEICRNTQ